MSGQPPNPRPGPGPSPRCALEELPSSIYLVNEAVLDLLLPELSPRSKLRFLYDDESTKDMTIAVRDGADLKCHRIIFKHHSTKLASMLFPEHWRAEADGKTGRVEWFQNSEEAVRHLLRYLYFKNVQPSKLSCEVAVELLKTAKELELTPLYGALQKLMRTKEKEWFEADLLLELYDFVKKDESFLKLRQHILHIMTSMPKEICACERFKEMDEEDVKELLRKTWEAKDNPRLKGSKGLSSMPSIKANVKCTCDPKLFK